jgi:signal transduction histidine kinase
LKIRTKLTLLFAGLFAALLLAFALAIYFSNAGQREQEYFKRLKQLAITKTNLLLEAGVQPDVLQLIYENSLSTLPQEEVAIFDTAYHLLYHDAMDIDKYKETSGMLDSIRTQKEIHFYYEDLQVNGFVYVFRGRSYVITAAARDEDGYARLKALRLELALGFGIAILLTLLAGFLFSQKALEPVSKMVGKVAEISASRMDLRLSEGNGKDEIAELALTFNRMLDRLEQSFDAQKQFVSNISHELRTPLAAIIAEAEVSAIKERTPEEYRATLRLLLQDARRLSRLSSDLLDLAKASYDTLGISFKELRLDEVLLDARQIILQANPDYKVDIIFEKEIEDGDRIVIAGNEYLLKVAFTNLIENACKFSADHRCSIGIGFTNEKTILRFRDTGIGIPAEDLDNIFTPFFRGGNKRYAPGNGIGLSLTKRIITLHQGTIIVQSHQGEGTTFTIGFSHS